MTYHLLASDQIHRVCKIEASLQSDLLDTNKFSGWLYQTKTHFTHIVYQPFSSVTPPNYIVLVGSDSSFTDRKNQN